ncbi:MAG: hypothetical protein U0452_09205 [Anaerolineae bacterium]
MSTPATAPPTSTEEQAAVGAKRALTAGLAFSAVRCILMYVILPFVLPIIGITGVFATRADIVINLLAMAALGYSVQRFWRINYKYKVAYTFVAVITVFVLAMFILLDLQELGLINLAV